MAALVRTTLQVSMGGANLRDRWGRFFSSVFRQTFNSIFLSCCPKVFIQ